jgi:ferredoxin
MTRRARLVIDPIACDGRALCAELLPELITLDDWGFPVITSGDIPAGLDKEAMAVARLCPRLALRVKPAPRLAARSRQRAPRCGGASSASARPPSRATSPAWGILRARGQSPGASGRPPLTRAGKGRPLWLQGARRRGLSSSSS